MTKKKPTTPAREAKADWLVRYFDDENEEMDCIKIYGKTMTEAHNQAMLLMPEDCDSNFKIQPLEV